MRLLRWVLAGLVLGALAAFVAQLVRPRPVSAGSGYRPPVPSTDHRVVLPGATG
jgi:hypothetical protein